MLKEGSLKAIFQAALLSLYSLRPPTQRIVSRHGVVIQFSHVGMLKKAHHINRGAHGVEVVLIRHGFACCLFHCLLGDAVMHAAGIVSMDGS